MGAEREPPPATTIADESYDIGDAMGLSLVLLGRGWVRTFPLPERGEVSIGRAPECSIVVDDPAVSRKHAGLSIGDALTVTDLGSRLGVTIDGARLSVGERREIAIGQPFSLGKLTAMIQAAPDSGGETGGGALAALERKVARLARGTLSILITGETGVGKELMGEQVHRLSPRAGAPLVKINCGAISESLLESELFGHEKGAFTGAVGAKLGLLEAADGGSVFLDEIGEMPLGLQVKLLRAIENRQVRRVGGLESRSYDVRFIAATNRDLREDVAAGRFREDLFYRLAGAIVRLPPLRERAGEILPLARGFLAEQAAAEGEAAPPALSPEATAWLVSYSWPGNVRELRNTMERAYLLADRGVIEREHLTEMVSAEEIAATGAGDAPPPGDADEIRARVTDALARTAGNQTMAAELLGVSRRTLVYWLDKYRIPRPRKNR